MTHNQRDKRYPLPCKPTQLRPSSDSTSVTVVTFPLQQRFLTAGGSTTAIKERGVESGVTRLRVDYAETYSNARHTHVLSRSTDV